MEQADGSASHAPTTAATTAPSTVIRCLDAMRRAPGIVPALRLIDDLVDAAQTASPSDLAPLMEAAADASDQVTGTGAVLALGALPASAGHAALLEILRSGPAHLREHAAWALAIGPASPDAVDALVMMVASGGFDAFTAQRTLERWAQHDATPVAAALVAAVGDETLRDARAQLVETLGLVPGAAVTTDLIERAADREEGPAVRAAAVAALGDRGEASGSAARAVLDEIAAGTDELAEVARAALHDLTPVRAAARETHGLTIAQLFLHADIDADLTHAGRGDNGGIATLLVQLGDALAATPGIERVVTISRGRSADALVGIDSIAAPGLHYASVPIWGPPPAQAQSWPLRVAARRGVRRILRAAAPVDAIHLRMADVGSMAAAETARDLGIPVVFTLAPDPQGLVAARETEGTLSRASFGAADLVEHLVLRDRLVREIAAASDHLVLLPRPDIERTIAALLGVDIGDPAVSATVVAEGVALDAIDAARHLVAGAASQDAVHAHLADLDELLRTLPRERRHLPLVVSVGRMHRVKGMATLVETWEGDAQLTQRCNLLVIGGDLLHPSIDEAAQLARIAEVVPPATAANRGLLLAGHRRNAVVATWLAAVRLGRPGLAAPDGIYVCASLKEEFGIAILEAMAAGLIAVAPSGGGPATYIEHGSTGLLVDTTSRSALAAAIARALGLARDPAVAAHAEPARDRLRERFGIGTMAQALERVYAAAARSSASGWTRATETDEGAS
ncbi:glycosyltransferase [Agrococcus sp. Ld7]|uniref:glycosyltransferase n=1 Tax=Agrococcus sp. Ld7 TaxID=649148 RepID=UPI00386BD2D7